jgi:hypothetical protein
MRRTVQTMSRLFPLILLFCVSPAWGDPTASPTAPPPTLLTVHLRDKPLSDALQLITAQTGIVFDKNSPRPREGFPDPTISIDRDRAPFWEVMAELSRLGGVSPMYRSAGRITLFPDEGRWGRQPAVLLGAIRINAFGIQSQKVIALGRSPKQSTSCQLQVEIEAEPKLTAVCVQNFMLQAVTDQDGRAVATAPPPRFQSKIVNFSRGNAGFELSLDPAPTVQRLALVRGSADVIIAPDARPAEVPDILHADHVKQQFGDLAVQVTCQTLPQDYSVQLIVDYNGDDEQFAKQLVQWIGSADIQLVDGAGVPYPFPAGQSGNHGRRGVARTLLFPRHPRRPPIPGAPEKLQWRMPTSFQLVPITFEFHDLDLP